MTIIFMPVLLHDNNMCSSVPELDQGQKCRKTLFLLQCFQCSRETIQWISGIWNQIDHVTLAIPPGNERLQQLKILSLPGQEFWGRMLGRHGMFDLHADYPISGAISIFKQAVPSFTCNSYKFPRRKTLEDKEAEVSTLGPHMQSWVHDGGYANMKVISGWFLIVRVLMLAFT